ncbi:hypothetical protein AB0M83_06745 [Amycolatopsis sp. NPDC051106]|uniref:hypothetical protein n=1 Tax=unclassified Amycolatopsis TaxID=2618356 RepID=UPI003422B0A5
MTDKNPAGSHIVAIAHQTVWAAVGEVVGALDVEGAARLKVRSGEHLAVVLTTAFLGSPPISTDLDGGTDLVFDLSETPPQWAPAMIGRGDARFADFEVKSLPGQVRLFDAAIERALARGEEPGEPTIMTRIVSVNDVVHAGRGMLDKAAEQLHRKSSPERARNIFLIAHMLDYMSVEFLDVVIAHHLEPLTDLPEDVDAVWMLFAPVHLVVWSVAEQRWTTLFYTAAAPGQELPGAEDEVDFLIAVDDEFRRQIGDDLPSPYAFKLTTSRPDDDGGNVAP